MNRRLLVLVLISTVMIISSCGGPKHYIVKENTMSNHQNKENKSIIIFIRQQSGFGGTHDVAVYDGDKLIGILSKASYVVYETEPGDHLFASYSAKLDFLKANVAPGKTYYVQASHQDLVGVLRSKIVAVKKDSDIMKGLDDMLPKLGNTELTEAGRKLYKVRNEPNGKFIIDDRAAFVTYRIDFNQARDEWFEKSKTVQKDTLSIDDGM
ncbi:MAG: hypothetical protein HKO79_05160 [Desulfobacterales bacterium]|nr:hypothetical protein [Desulfobacterales bacterium]NNL41861.1 hypothetical protein [Desulfobacterales bacterium]